MGCASLRLLLVLSAAVCPGLSEDKPRPVLSVTPQGTIYEGDAVNLTCRVQDPFTGWRYQWYRLVQYKPGLDYILYNSQYYYVEPLPDSVGGAPGSYTLRPAALTHTGTYVCRAVRGTPDYYTHYSDPHALEVKDKPRPVLSVTPQGTICEGELVTLTCWVQDPSTGWKYQWYRLVPDNTGSDYVWYNSQKYYVEPLADSVGGAPSSYTLRPAALTHTGTYVCRAVRGTPRYYTHYSDPHALEVKVRPHAILTLQSDWTPIFSGQKVTFRCEVPGGLTDWTYSWYKDNSASSVHNGKSDTMIFSPVEVSHSGQYTCAGEQSSSPLYSKKSSAVKLTVSDKPRPILSITPQGTIYEGDVVTLTCRVQDPSTGWRYQWYRLVQYKPGLDYILYNSQYYYVEPLPDSVGGAPGSYTLRPAALTHTGTYVCRAVRGTPDYYTHYSDPHALEVKDKPRPVLSVTPQGTIYEGESVTLTCRVQVSSTRWSYQWHRLVPDNTGSDYVWYNSQKYYVEPLADSVGGAPGSYTLRPAALTHTGTYVCRAVRGTPGYYTHYSDPHALEVKEGRPKPVVSMEPPWTQVFVGEPVTLSCELGDPSPGWRYQWFKDSLEIPVSRRAGLSAAGDRYTISSASVSDQGQYWCGVERGHESFSSELSDVLRLNISELLSPATLTVRPNRSQHFAGRSLSLSCVVNGNSSELWTVRQHVVHPGEQSVCKRPGPCKISPTRVSHSGLYWCESGSGEQRSLAVSISVHSGHVILDGPTQPLAEGDSLTLTCVRKNEYPTEGAQFYKDGQEVMSSSQGHLTVGAVGHMDSGSYRCKHSYWGESAEMWVTVRALISTVTLTVTPGALMRTGVTLNFTCVALVNKWTLPALSFSLLRDNGTVSSSTVSSSTGGNGPRAQWSSLIENVDGNHTGTYRCRVTGPTGLRSDSQELQVTVEEVSMLPVTVGLGLTLGLLLFIVLISLCFRSRGYSCAGKTRVCAVTQDKKQNKRLRKNQVVSAVGPTHPGDMELSNMTQLPGENNCVYEEIEVKDTGAEGSSVEGLVYSDVVFSKKKSSGQARPRPKEKETIYSPIVDSSSADARDDTYTEVKPKKKRKKKPDQTQPLPLYAELHL